MVDVVYCHEAEVASIPWLDSWRRVEMSVCL
jgi:hypothetical protein